MTRALVSRTPHVDVGKLVRWVRGNGRGGPRAKRAERVRSDGQWTASGLTSRLWVGDSVVWSLGASLEVDGRAGVLRLHYRWDGREHERVTELRAEPMHLGGVRWWAVCPSCARRCGLVFVDGAQLGCRVCFGLTYESTRRKAGPRSRETMFALAQRIDDGSTLEWGLPPKPPRMRWRTYEKLEQRFDAAAARDAAYFVRMARHFGFG